MLRQRADNSQLSSNDPSRAHGQPASTSSTNTAHHSLKENLALNSYGPTTKRNLPHSPIPLPIVSVPRTRPRRGDSDDTPHPVNQSAPSTSTTSVGKRFLSKAKSGSGAIFRAISVPRSATSHSDGLPRGLSRRLSSFSELPPISEADSWNLKGNATLQAFFDPAATPGITYPHEYHDPSAGENGAPSLEEAITTQEDRSLSIPKHDLWSLKDESTLKTSIETSTTCDAPSQIEHSHILLQSLEDISFNNETIDCSVQLDFSASSKEHSCIHGISVSLHAVSGFKIVSVYGSDKLLTLPDAGHHKMIVNLSAKASEIQLETSRAGIDDMSDSLYAEIESLMGYQLVQCLHVTTEYSRTDLPCGTRLLLDQVCFGKMPRQDPIICTPPSMFSCKNDIGDINAQESTHHMLDDKNSEGMIHDSESSEGTPDQARKIWHHIRKDSKSPTVASSRLSSCQEVAEDELGPSVAAMRSTALANKRSVDQETLRDWQDHCDNLGISAASAPTDPFANPPWL